MKRGPAADDAAAPSADRTVGIGQMTSEEAQRAPSAGLAEPVEAVLPRYSIILLFFVLSGASSLLYQVVWVRLLSLFFGSDVYSATITLSVFMAGLALGSRLAGLVGDRVRNPLLVYGALEILTGVAALFVPHILTSFQSVYQQIYNNDFDTAPWLYHGFRAAVAAATLIVPTTLMGATLPLLVRYTASREADLGQRAGSLYAVNTAGALMGALVTGFVLLPLFGVAHTVVLGVAVNLLIGTCSVGLSLSDAARRPTTRPKITTSQAVPRSRGRGVVLLVIALSGMASLGLEIIWMRVLVQSFSATVYAFTIMLACFLFGIYYGSLRASRVVDRAADLGRSLGLLELGIAVSVTALAVVSYFAPSVFGSLVWGLTGVLRGQFAVASVLAQIIIASILILGPTTMLGATFPIAVKLYTPDIRFRARGAGNVYAANTAGAIIGAILGGFVVLPAFGTLGGMIVIAAVFLVAGLLAMSASAGPLWASLMKPAPVLCLGVTIPLAAVALQLPPRTVINYDLQKSYHPTMVYHGEGIANTVDIVRNERGDTIMSLNGNVEADTSLIQRRHFVLKAYLPLLLQKDPKDVAVVGLGLGITLRSTARFPTVRHIRVVELSTDIVRAHQFLKDITGDILANPIVALRIDDGRNFMAMSHETFDMITADPIHPRITGVGYLYTREYYNTIKARLNPGGTVTQWMPMYNISRKSFDVAFRTFAEVFPNSSFWYVRGHGLFVATDGPLKIDCQRLVQNFNAPKVKADFASVDISSPEQFLGYMLMDREHIAQYLARNQESEINTDDNALLEYRTPFEFLGRTDQIVPDLVKYAGWDIDTAMADCDAGMRDKVRGFFEGRLANIEPELKTPIE